MSTITWDEILNICKRINFPESAVTALEEGYAKIMQNPPSKWQTTVEEWLNPEADWQRCLKDLSVMSGEVGLSANMTRMLFFLYCAVPLRAEYEKRGLPETLYWETLQDLRYKLMECHNVKDEWGTFVPDWYRRFYVCERFALGRLQYEQIPFPFEGYKNLLKKGDMVLSCHIPSSGALRENDVLESLKKAYEFYQAECMDGLLPITCHSWLLYQPLEEVFADSPNVQKFRNMFDVIQNDADKTNEDFWRVFYQEFSEETLKNAPTETKLQKRLKNYLLEGNTLGCGWGVLLFDGERIRNR